MCAKAAKKPATAKAATTKAPAKRVAVAKKPVARKKATKKAPSMRSFHVYRSNQQFNDFRITRQTVYWIILMCFIIFVQLWILKLQYDVMHLIDLQEIESISLYQ